MEYQIAATAETIPADAKKVDVDPAHPDFDAAFAYSDLAWDFPA